mmetsp:Transcript_44691/g.93562  ORF Transcript_44691/g.93562 Transcript_44691/m.93562 type:complete len:306 (+) Transcript_44691:120-1037(+)
MLKPQRPAGARIAPRKHDSDASPTEGRATEVRSCASTAVAARMGGPVPACRRAPSPPGQRGLEHAARRSSSSLRHSEHGGEWAGGGCLDAGRGSSARGCAELLEEGLVDGPRVHLLVEHVAAHARLLRLPPLLLRRLPRQLLLAAEDLALAGNEVAPHRLLHQVPVLLLLPLLRGAIRLVHRLATLVLADGLALLLREALEVVLEVAVRREVALRRRAVLGEEVRGELVADLLLVVLVLHHPPLRLLVPLLVRKRLVEVPHGAVDGRSRVHLLRLHHRAPLVELRLPLRTDALHLQLLVDLRLLL